jgi:prepilin-type N-terminal cleavage/methylation domain-containing protein
MKRRPRARERGFTMVELLVTMTISLFALMGGLAIHSSMTGGLATSAQMSEATVVAVQTMEKLRAKRTLDVAEEITGSTATQAPFARDGYASVIGRNGLTYTVDVAVAALSATLWKIRIDVNWQSDATGEGRSVALELVRASAESL